MKPNPFETYNFIAVEGNIGAGKTTLCTQMSEEFNTNLILEDFSDNPFLPKFYQNQERYAFPVELFFMTERHKQLQEGLLSQDLFHKGTVSDYYFLKTLLFAKNNLKEDEYRLFQRIFYILSANFPKPNLLVYLHRPVDNLLRNIAKRGRNYEQSISPEYLQSIQNTYFEYFRTELNFPILIIDVEKADFLNIPEDYTQLIEMMCRPYKRGINYVMTTWQEGK